MTDRYDATFEVVDDTAIVEVAGDVDLAAQSQLRAALDLALGEGGPVVIDLTYTRLIDSSGIVVLLQAWRTMQAAGREMVLRHPSPEVRRVLTVTGLSEAIDDRPMANPPTTRPPEKGYPS